MTEFDPKGGIPDFAIQTVMKNQGLQVDLLRKVVPKWKKIFPGDKPDENQM